jgi:hypothetical protein
MRERDGFIEITHSWAAIYMRQKNGEQIEDKEEASYAMLRDLGNMGGRNS